MQSLSEILSEDIANIKFSNLPKKIVDLTKLCLLDMIGAAIAGSLTEPARIVQEWALLSGGRPESPIFCSTYKLPAHMTALINGTMGHIVELDDVNSHCYGHPGVAIIPAVLGLAYREKASGAETISAIVAGYETMGRLGQYLTAEHYKLWHATATLGTFGAVVGAAKILNLSKSKIINALGIGGSFASGLRQVFVGGTYCKHLHAGKAAQSGVISAELANRGFTGPVEIFDGPLGIGKAMSTATNDSKIIKRKEEPYEIEFTEFKPYASCRSAHTAIDCVLNFMDKFSHIIHIEKIRSIRIYTTNVVYSDPAWSNINPQNSLEAKLSIPYNTVVAMIDGEAFLNQYTEERINSADVRHLLRLTELHPCPEIDEYYPETTGCRVTIEFNDNQQITEQVLFPRGDPRNPLNTEEITKKFSYLASMRYTSEIIEQLVNEISKVDELEDVSSLLDLLSMHV